MSDILHSVSSFLCALFPNFLDILIFFIITIFTFSFFLLITHQVLRKEVTFQEIMRQYRHQPQAKSHVRYVNTIHVHVLTHHSDNHVHVLTHHPDNHEVCIEIVHVHMYMYMYMIIRILYHYMYEIMKCVLNY